MQRWSIEQLVKMWDRCGCEVILNDGEVLGFEKLDVNIKHRTFNYFVYVKKPDYSGKR